MSQRPCEPGRNVAPGPSEVRLLMPRESASSVLAVFPHMQEETLRISSASVSRR